MRKDAWIRLLLIVLINSQILFYIAGSQEESGITFKILNNGEVIGKLKEKREECKKFVKYEKHLHYFGGENIFSKFKLSHDFSHITGKVFKNNRKWLVIKNNVIRADDNEKIKNYRLPVGTIFSSIMNLYIHEMFKKEIELPDKMKVFYENTGDILEVKIKKIIREKYVEIEYHFDKINLQMVELFFPKENAYFIRCGSIYFIDERLENSLIPDVLSNLKNQNNIVTTYENFNGFSDADSILYKLTFASDISIPVDNRQIIIEEQRNGSEKTFLLKATKEKVTRNEENIRKYNEYLLSFDKLDNIRKLSYKVTKGINDQDKKIQKIMKWIKENISPSNDETFDPELVLKSRKGDCQGISNLFLTMCSALNIPGRAIAGIVILNQNGKYFYSYHQWVELWKESHWIPCDPSFGLIEIGLNYIKLINLERKVDLIRLINALENLKIEIIKEYQ